MLRTHRHATSGSYPARPIRDLGAAARLPYSRADSLRRRAHFRGQNTEASPYRQTLDRLPPSTHLSASAELVRQRLDENSPARPCGLSVWLSYSRREPYSRPRSCHAPAAVVTDQPAPHAGHVERSRRETNPVDRISGLTASHRLCSRTAHFQEKMSLSASPPFCTGCVYRIEREDYSATIQRQLDYSREPPSSTDKPVSRHPALPAKRLTDG